MSYSKSEIEALSSTRGLINLLIDEHPDFSLALKKLKFKKDLRNLQTDLIKMQNWVVEKNQRVLIIFEGGEFAGKGTAIRSFLEHINPRNYRLVALPKPTKTEAGQWYFQRYVNQLPIPGEIVFFDRSWYNRALVEPVNGFCTKKQYKQFMSEVNHFENMIHNDGIIFIKLYFSISKEEQGRRIELVRQNPLRRWELTKVDENAQKNWDKFISYEKEMFKQTHSKNIPWHVIDGNDKYQAQLDAIQKVLKIIPFISK